MGEVEGEVDVVVYGKTVDALLAEYGGATRLEEAIDLMRAKLLEHNRAKVACGAGPMMSVDEAKRWDALSARAVDVVVVWANIYDMCPPSSRSDLARLLRPSKPLEHMLYLFFNRSASASPEGVQGHVHAAAAARDFQRERIRSRLLECFEGSFMTAQYGDDGVSHDDGFQIVWYPSNTYGQARLSLRIRGGRSDVSRAMSSSVMARILAYFQGRRDVLEQDAQAFIGNGAERVIVLSSELELLEEFGG